MTHTDLDDAVLSLARAAAEEEGPGLVGEPVPPADSDDAVTTVAFATLDPAYAGWQWLVTVVDGTVDEVVLLPGEGALLAPAWLPYSERIQPGDLGVGDVMETPADDPRLVPAAWSDADDEQVAETAWELGLGRARVLSLDGRVEATERWYVGDAGPEAAIARSAPASCATCGFFLPLAGALRQAFGACANEYAPDDGRVVSVDHGCGAHSEAIVAPEDVVTPPSAVTEHVLDLVGGPVIPSSVTAEHDPGSVDDSEATEPLGHS